MQQLKKNYETFMESDIPQTMKDCFKDWDELLFTNNDSQQEKKRRALLLASKE